MAMISVAGLSRFLENLRSIFVAKDGNKVLSDNNFTDVDYDKLDGIAYNADSMNKMQEKSLERSNVEYSSTLTSLMVYQKAFEASSKSITTSDDFLKTAIEMVK